ncbi:MAG: 1-acyl-sn-glycerol-3-phosphate acyltransferase [Bellilinea sp.]|nr:1-acyl-sn-glycerol-3-phosphate acyltransferase [Bellilinea sp.]
MTLVGRIILPVFAKVQTDGINRLPKKGPAILAGNHENIIEVILMAVYSPAVVEFIGTGDVPIAPRFAWLANMYQFIPVKRGNIDRTAIYTALEVLKAGGVIGIFPQGGIWGADIKNGRSGVALLSHLSGAPVYPIGFGGLKGALMKMMRFEKPHLTMRVGSPLRINGSPISKHDLEQFSSMVMEKIVELLPEEEQNRHYKKYEKFDLEIYVQRGKELSSIALAHDSEIRIGLGMFFHYPVLLDTLKRNLGLPVDCLQNIGNPVPARDVEKAIQAVLDYLEDDNPGFLTYRFGVEKGLRVKQGLQKLMSLLADHKEDHQLIFVPVYAYSENGRVITLRGSDSLHPLV